MDADQLAEVFALADIPHARPSRGNMSVSCPLAPWRSPPHQGGRDRSPSLSVKCDPNGTSLWHCFCCDARGSVVSLFQWLIRLTGPGVYGAALELALKYDPEDRTHLPKREVEPEAPRPGPPVDLIRECVKKGVPKYVIEDRKIKYEVARAWWLGLDDSSGWVRKYGGPRVVFPVLDQTAKLVGAVGRYIGDIPEDDTRGLRRYVDYGFEKGMYLYGEHLAARDVRQFSRRAVVLTEGAFDVLRTVQNMQEAGPPQIPVVGGLTKTLSPEQAEKILDWGTRVVYLGQDGDEPGERGVATCRKMLAGRVMLFRIPVPPGKDLGALSADQWLAAFNGARPCQ